jgi:hypothetical protein
MSVETYQTQLIKKKKPKKPDLIIYWAVFLELVFVTVFIYYKSFVGAVAYILYFNFSALRALLFDRFTDD